MSNEADRYRRIRAELCELFGFNPGALSIDQEMRIDLATGLKVQLDALRAKLYAGGDVDVSRLLALSEAMGKYLPLPPVPPSKSNREDPREKIWRMYLRAREAGEILDPEERSEVERLRARVAELEAGSETKSPPAPTEPDTPQAENVVPLRPVTMAVGEVAPAPAPAEPPLRNPSEPAWQQWRDAGGYGGDGGFSCNRKAW